MAQMEFAHVANMDLGGVCGEPTLGIFRPHAEISNAWSTPRSKSTL